MHNLADLCIGLVEYLCCMFTDLDQTGYMCTTWQAQYRVHGYRLGAVQLYMCTAEASNPAAPRQVQAVVNLQCRQPGGATLGQAQLPFTFVELIQL